MKIINRYYHDWNAKQRQTLKSFGIQVEKGYASIEIEENQANSPIVQIIEEWGVEKFYWTDYDKKDYENSSYFVYVSTWFNGYPMPDDDGGFLALTYNINEYCSTCGVGKYQKAPFRIKTNPKWGNKLMFELNWIYDEIFVHTALYDKLFKKKGLKFKEVLLYKKEKVIEDTVQLEIPIINIPLQLKDQPYEICNKCNRKKYAPQVKGLFPSFQKAVPDLQIFKSSEYFGNGHEAHNNIFITRELWEELKSLKIKLNVWPVQPI